MQTFELTKTEAALLYKGADNTGKKLLEDKFGKENLVEDLWEKIKSFEEITKYYVVG